jgi:glycosyltransferase involved in cell wall biosynthesis
MRIMIATETYTPSVNGAAVFSQRLAVGLAGRGHHVAVVAPSPTGHPFTESHESRLTIYRVRSIPTPYPSQRCALLTERGARALLTAFNPDLLHIQNHFVLGRIVARAARVRRIPVVGTNHFMPENILPYIPRVLAALRTSRVLQHWLWRQFVRVYGQLDAVTVPSHAAAELTRSQGLKVPLHIISNGIDVARFHPARGQDFPGGDRLAPGPIILYVGRLDPDKGLETPIRALPFVAQHCAAFLVLCGRGVHESALGFLAKTLSVSARVRFPGFVPEDQLPDMYRAATLFVMPSTNELQSLATLEAMASGLPVVAARAMALPELVEEGKNGFLFPPGDHLALADRMVCLLSDPPQVARMGQRSREVAERHSIDLTLGAFESLYQDLLKSQR